MLEKKLLIQDYSKSLVPFSNEDLDVPEDAPHHIKDTIYVFREFGNTLLKEEAEYAASVDSSVTATAKELNEKLGTMKSADPTGDGGHAHASANNDNQTDDNTSKKKRSDSLGM